MPTKTTISQRGRVVLVPTPHFELSTMVTELVEDDLPYPDIFVYKIDLVDDPKEDVFQRIGTVQDLTTLARGRDTAMARKESTYLSSTCTLSYADAPTANDAKQLIQARVDALILAWRTYTTELSDDSLTEFPLIAPGIIKGRIAAYEDAKRASQDADGALATAERTLAAAKATLEIRKGALLAATTARMDCVQHNGTLSQLQGVTTAFRSTVNDALTELEAYPEPGPAPEEVAAAACATRARDLLHTALAAQNAAGEATLASLIESAAASCETKRATLENAVRAKAEADTAVADAETTLAVATALATTAQAAADEAYRQAQEMCPRYEG